MFQSAIGTRNAQPSLKQRITENSASMAIRRQGAASATDIQQPSGKVPTHERSVHKHRNSVAKKQLNTANNVSVQANRNSVAHIQVETPTIAQHPSVVTTTKPVNSHQARLNKLSMRQR